MEPVEAFLGGFLTARAGIPFRGMAIMDAVRGGASEALAARIEAQIDAFRARNGDTVDTVLRVEAILGKNGLALPPRPRTLDDFVAWAGGASRAIGAALAPESPATAALLSGGFLGDAAAATTLGIVVLGLAEVAPEHAPITTQLTAAHQQLGDATARLAATLRHPTLVPAARVPLQALLTAIQHAPALDGHDTIVARLSAHRVLLGEINARLSTIVNAFAPAHSPG